MNDGNLERKLMNEKNEWKKLGEKIKEWNN